MRRFNEIMAHHFREFECVLAVRDPHRNRLVRVFNIREDDNGVPLVGISDGVESWVARVTSGIFPDYDLPQLIKAKVAQRGNTNSQAAGTPRSGGRVSLLRA